MFLYKSVAILITFLFFSNIFVGIPLKAKGTSTTNSITVDVDPYAISNDITIEGMYGEESAIAISVNASNDYPIAEGTFIQDWLVSNWDDARWQQEFAMLKEAGMEYLVFGSALHTDISDVPKAIYATSMENVQSKYSTDLIDKCLRNAQEAGFKIFIGLNFHDRWWRSYTPEWLYEQVELGNQVADELVDLYKAKYGDTFYGWYWVWEIDNLNYKTQQKQDMLINALNINIDYLNEITPDMPFLFCPFVNYRIGNSHGNRDMWKYILPQVHFREGDIFGPQDCIGAGGLELSMLDEWFRLMSEVVDSIPGLQFWSDAETFDQRFWTAGTLDRFIEQLQIVEPYVDKIISFAYSHYYSPFLKKKNFHEGYVEYYQTGSLPVTGSPEPVADLSAGKNENGEIILTWNEPGNLEDIVGYLIYRNGKLIGDMQYNNYNRCETTFKDANIPENENLIYDVYSYTITSVKSPKRSIYLGKFYIEVVVEDKDTGESLPDSKIIFGSSIAMTNDKGVAFFELDAGEYEYSVEKNFYIDQNGMVTVNSDSTFTFYLNQTFSVEVVVDDESTKKALSGSRVSLGDSEEATNELGSASFELSPGEYEYSIQKNSYQNQNGMVTINSDTTLSFHLSRTSAFIKFYIKEGSTPVNNAIVIVNGDTLVTSNLGLVTYRELPVGESYDYFIQKSGYRNLNGSIYLETDTTLNMQMEVYSTAIRDLENKNGIKIWPNPAHEIINCQIPDSYHFSQVQIIGLNGKIFKIYNIGDENTIRINLIDIPAGLYLMKMIPSNNHSSNYPGIIFMKI